MQCSQSGGHPVVFQASLGEELYSPNTLMVSGSLEYVTLHIHLHKLDDSML